MSTRYDLPKQSASSPLLRNLFVWGLPILGWAVLVLCFVTFLAPEGEEPSAPAADRQPAQALPAAPPASDSSAAQRPSASPAQPPAASASAFPVDGSPRSAAAAAAALPSAPYDFSGAVSKIGLPKEDLCLAGILVDPAARKVLWAKHADRAVPIASMTKMMTLLLAEEDLAAGVVSRDTVIQVTKEAYEIGGSQVWLDPRESFPLSELLKAVAIKSANDAAYLVGEYLGRGDIDAFVARMNRRAEALGMKTTHFYDPHGLGDSQKRHNTASPHDMVILGEALLAYPEVIRLASTRMDTFRSGKTELKNHNNLVFDRVPGVDGLKTGYTNAAGFCVTFSCLRDGRRLLGCVTGYKRPKDRDAFCKALLDWGYAH